MIEVTNIPFPFFHGTKTQLCVLGGVGGREAPNMFEIVRKLVKKPTILQESLPLYFP